MFLLNNKQSKIHDWILYNLKITVGDVLPNIHRTDYETFWS